MYVCVSADRDFCSILIWLETNLSNPSQNRNLQIIGTDNCLKITASFFVFFCVSVVTRLSIFTRHTTQWFCSDTSDDDNVSPRLPVLMCRRLTRDCRAMRARERRRPGDTGPGPGAVTSHVTSSHHRGRAT